MGAGLWVMFLIFYRQLDKPNGRKEGLIQTSIGVQWGIFIAFLLGALLAYAGYRIRAAHVPEPALEDDARPRRTGRRRPDGRRPTSRSPGHERPRWSPAAAARDAATTRSRASSPSTSRPSTARRRAASPMTLRRTVESALGMRGGINLEHGRQGRRSAAGAGAR